MTAPSHTSNEVDSLLALDNGVKIELLGDEEGYLLGLGRVWAGETLLRSPAVPLRPYLKSERGVVYPRFRLDRIEHLEDGGVAIHTTALGIPLLESAYEDEYSGVLLMVEQRQPKVEDSLVWTLRPEQVRIEETAYAGFSYAWRFSSKTERIFRVLAVTTWELGGAAEGNTLLSQGQVTTPVYTAEKGTHFTSACLKQIRRFGDPRGMSYQLTPRYGLHQVFDFMGGPRGTLLGYWPERADVRSFVQKNPGEGVFFMVDATHFTLTAQVEIPRKCILFAPADTEGMPEHVMRNRWKDASDYCTGLTRALFGVKRSRVLPESTIGYSVKLQDDGRVLMRVGESWVPSQEWLIAMADTYFEELASRGIRRVIPEPIVRTDPTERGLLCKLRDGIHGDMIVGSVCCVHRYVPADFWGGIEAWKYYYGKAHRCGLEVGHWIGPHLSYNSPIVQAHPDWVCHAVTTLVASGGYPNFELACMNWNTGVRQWILEDLKRWKEEFGLDYVWFDSLGNLGMYPVDYSRQMQSNTLALVEFIADLQRIGIADIEIEGVSPFGVSACGLFDPNQGPIREAQDIVGQNSLDWFVGNEDMLCDQQMRAELHPDRSEEESRQIFFRFLANRAITMMGRFAYGFGPRPDWFKGYLAQYFTVEEDLVRRRLLPNRQGVLWTGGKAEVLFAFAPVTINIPANARIARLHYDASEPVRNTGKLVADAWSVHRIASA